jgi:ribosome-associated heat shock protein Hsp15
LQADRQRLDRWLWHARLVRTRALAAALAASGHVRLNGQRVDAPGRGVKVGDVVTVALPRAVRVLKIVAFAPRREAAVAARGLYDELSTSAERPERAAASRPSGSGRPTKRDRRALDRWRGRI